MKFLADLAIGISTAGVASILVACAADSPEPRDHVPVRLDPTEASLVSLVNYLRSSEGACNRVRMPRATALLPDRALQLMADDAALALSDSGVVSHDVEGLGSPERRARRRHVVAFSGEALFSGTAQPVDVVRAWSQSPAHCAVVRDAAARRVGVAIRPVRTEPDRHIFVLVTARSARGVSQ